jgi:adenine phosphoribosyltransferase
MAVTEKIKAAIRDIPDFPEPGILFKDITPIFQEPLLCREILDQMAVEARILRPDVIVGVESRGFFFGLPLSWELGIPFVPIRKKGKLPYETISHAYDLEYGSAIIEMHSDAIAPGKRVLIHDDLLATGGTAYASAELVRKCGATVVGFSFLVELKALGGRQKLNSFTEKFSTLASY